MGTLTSRGSLLINRHSTSLRFPFACLANKRRKVAITPVSDSLRGPRENKWGQIQPDSLPIFTKEVHIESRTIARRALLRCCRFRSAF